MKFAIKFFTFVVSLFFTTSVFATDVKLLCKLDMAKTYRGGQIERDRITEIFEIKEFVEYLSIIPHSDNLASFSTSKLQNTISISNHSDRNKWHITSSHRNREGGTVIKQISIDRNSGVILYSYDWEGGTILERGNGECEKISQEKRKF